MDPMVVSDAIDQATTGVLRTCDAEGLVRLGVISAIAAKLHPVPAECNAYDWYSEKCFIQGGINDEDWLNLALKHIPAEMPEGDALKIIMTASGGRQNPSLVIDGIRRSRASSPSSNYLRDMVRSTVNGVNQARLLHLLDRMEHFSAIPLPSAIHAYKTLSAEFDAELAAYRQDISNQTSV